MPAILLRAKFLLILLLPEQSTTVLASTIPYLGKYQTILKCLKKSPPQDPKKILSSWAGKLLNLSGKNHYHTETTLSFHKILKSNKAKISSRLEACKKL